MTADGRSHIERDEYESAVSHLSSVSAESAKLTEPFAVDLDVLERKPPGIPWRLPQKRFRIAWLSEHRITERSKAHEIIVSIDYMPQNATVCKITKVYNPRNRQQI